VFNSLYVKSIQTAVVIDPLDDISKAPDESLLGEGQSIKILGRACEILAMMKRGQEKRAVAQMNEHIQAVC